MFETAGQVEQFKLITAKQSSGLELFDRMDVLDMTMVIDSESLALASKYLSVAIVLGFDTESKPIFVEGVKNKGPHVIQLATLNKAFIFHHSYMEGMNYALKLLESKKVKKIGIGLGGDRKLLLQKYDCALVNTIDLNSVLQPLVDWTDSCRGRLGIQSLVATFLNKRLIKPKKAQLSNWAVMPFSKSQIKYAGNDAYVALYIWNQFADKIKPIK